MLSGCQSLSGFRRHSRAVKTIIEQVSSREVQGLRATSNQPFILPASCNRTTTGNYQAPVIGFRSRARFRLFRLSCNPPTLAPDRRHLYTKGGASADQAKPGSRPADCFQMLIIQTIHQRYADALV